MKPVEELQEVIGFLRAGVPAAQAYAAVSFGDSQVELAELRAFADRFGVAQVELLELIQSRWLEQQQHEHDVATAAAQPRSTAHLLTWLPPAVLALCELAGLPVFRALANPLVLLAAALGCCLLWAASSWMRRLIERATKLVADEFLPLDLLAAATRAGVAVEPVWGELASAATQACHALVQRCLEFSRESGASVGELLTLKARQARSTIRQEQRIRAQQLGVKLVIPLGLTVLPAFMLMVVIPVAAAVQL